MKSIEILDSLKEYEQKIFLEILDSLNEDKKKILISLSLDEVIKKIYEYLKEKISKSLNEDEKKIFLKILDSLNEDEQKVILSKKLEIKKYYITYARYYEYKTFITANNIKKEYIPFKQILEEIKLHLSDNDDKLDDKLDDNQFDDISGEIQELREASYRLILKLKKEDNVFYKKNKLDKLEKEYFDDLKRRYYIKREDKNFHKNKIEIKKKIEDFKKNVYNENESNAKLQDISSNRIYIDSNTMFDFLIYVVSTSPKKINITNNESRYSYNFYKSSMDFNRNGIMLDELFRVNGFSFKKSNNENIISFEELYESTYNSDIEWQKEILEKYKKHEYIIYLFYTLSKNISLDSKVRSKILNDLKFLNFLYPYSDDILYLISSIKDNLKPNEEEQEKQEKQEEQEKQEKQEKQKLKQSNNDDFIKYKGFTFIGIEYYANEININKNRTLFEYFQSFLNFTARLDNYVQNTQNDHQINIEKDKSFIGYIFYILELIQADYRFKYFRKYYVSEIIHKIYLEPRSDNYETRLFLDYLRVNIRLIRILNNLIDYYIDKKYSFVLEAIVKKYQYYFSFFNDLFSIENKAYLDIYWNFRNEQSTYDRVIFFEYSLIKLGYKLNELQKKGYVKNFTEKDKEKWSEFAKKTFKEDKKLKGWIENNFYKYIKDNIDVVLTKDYLQAIAFHNIYTPLSENEQFDINIFNDDERKYTKEDENLVKSRNSFISKLNKEKK